MYGPEDFESIGFAELLEQGSVVAIEWPERVESLLPTGRIDVRITTTGEDARRIEIDRTGAAAADAGRT